MKTNALDQHIWDTLEAAGLYGYWEAVAERAIVRAIESALTSQGLDAEIRAGLVVHNYKLSAVAESMGVPLSTLRGWIKRSPILSATIREHGLKPGRPKSA